MRALPFAMVVALSVGTRLEAQTAAETREMQERVRKTAQTKSEELSDRVRATTLGTLSPEAEWNQAVTKWKSEKNAGAGPLLAEGVLFDCLGRLQGVKTRLLTSEDPVPYFADLAAQRPARAARAFDAALKIDPALIEARMRAARIRAAKDPRAALELERLAEAPIRGPFAYIAAISRAEAARARDDKAGARRWYDRAVVLDPRSAAAAIALSSLHPGPAIAFAQINSDDLYYTYPCTVLTATIRDALSERVRNLVPR
jgi:hypothetical protein